MFKSRSFRLARPSCRCRLALCIALALGQYSAFAADITAPPTEPVKGRAPTASTPVFVNKSASGKNPAIDDQIEASYAFTDVDGDAEDSNNGVFQWKADASNIANATTKTFVPTAAQLKKFLTFDATPGTNPLITDPDRAVSAVTSLPSGGPVLPSRAQLASEFIKGPNSMRWGDAYMYCANQGERLPTVAELQALFTTYTRANAVGEESRGDIVNTYGWTVGVHWSSAGNDSTHDYVYIHTNGQRSNNVNSNNYSFACIKAGAGEGLPTVTAVSIPNATVSTPVTVEYTYVSNATIPGDRSRFQWYTATSASGAGKVIAAGNGATTHTYTPVAADSGKFLMIEITPASYDTVVGAPVTAVSTPVLTAILGRFVTPQAIARTWPAAKAYCDSLGSGARLPTQQELGELWSTATHERPQTNEMCSIHGWPLSNQCGGSDVSNFYWSSTRAGEGINGFPRYFAADLTTGQSLDFDGSQFLPGGLQTACIR